MRALRSLEVGALATNKIDYTPRALSKEHLKEPRVYTHTMTEQTIDLTSMGQHSHIRAYMLRLEQVKANATHKYNGIKPSLGCTGFCTMGTVGAFPKPLILEDLWQVGRTIWSHSRDRKDCTYV